MLNTENAIIRIIASAYRGSSPSRKKYGLQMFPNWLVRLIIAVAHARFSGVWLTADAAHVYTSELAAKQPQIYRNDEKYLAAVFKVDTLMTNPTTAVAIEPPIW